MLKNLLFVNRFDYVLLNTLLFVNRFDYVLLKKIVSEAKPVYICVLFIANFFYNYN